ncbi:MAG: thiamine phosphate synthase [Bauldia sp.]|nr:thiamine phosphate synthase [Bauldia sp.]
MPGRTTFTTRLCLVTPAVPAAGFISAFEAALAAGDVASAIVASRAGGTADGDLAKKLAPLAHRHGCALLLAGEGDAGRLDGVHVETGLAGIRAAIAGHHPDRIVGAGGIQTRHDAMDFGEAGADYVFFGRLDGDAAPGIDPKAMELAAWWADLFEVPAMVMGGSDIASVREAAAAGVEFVALRNAVWTNADGAAAAVVAACRLLGTATEVDR